MKISIIIPSMNRLNLLQQLLIDLADQTMKPDEIVVVDQSNNPYDNLNCKHVIDSKKGPCRARNLGAKNCKGDILVFLDDDIRIGSKFLSEICSPILNGKFSAVCGAICDKDGNYLRNDRYYWRTQSTSILRAMTISPSNPVSGLSLSFPGGCSAISRDVFYQIGGFDLFFDPDGAGEDREIAIRLFNSGYPVFYNSNAKLHHLLVNYGGRKDKEGYHFDMIGANIAYIVGIYFDRTN